MPAIYDESFYASLTCGSRSSAAAIVPLLVDALRPATVVDIGCGEGFWPIAFTEAGVETAHGVDGPWAREAGLAIPMDSFFEFDFQSARPPFQLPLPQSRYDLVTSFEFVEHVDAELAPALVDLFCAMSDVVVVSAAVPFQGGVHHVNEQWPHYWEKLFRVRGYEACDFVRPKIWGTDVEPWYAQNIIAYFKGGAPQRIKAAAVDAWSEVANGGFSFVHPAMWTLKMLEFQNRPTLSQRLANLPRRVAGRIKRGLIR